MWIKVIYFYQGHRPLKNNTMLNNHIYNLLLQATEEHKSLWRIKGNYHEDAKDCAECSMFWEKLAEDKEQHVAELEAMIKKHL